MQLRHFYATGRKGAFLGIVSNLALAIFKLAAGIIGKSNAMIADALHTTSDLLSSAVVYVGFKIAETPPDEHHPYGHARAESVAAKIVSIILLFFGVKVFICSLMVILGNKISTPGIIALYAAIISIIVKLVTYKYTLRLGNKIDSTSLKGDAQHHKSDMLSSIAVLIGIGCARISIELWYMDAVAGMIVAGMVIKIGFDMFHRAYDELLDAAPSKDLRNKIEGLIMQTDGVMDFKDLNIRKLGLELHIDAKIKVDRKMSVEESHNITIKIKRDIRKALPNAKSILIHVEPLEGTDPPSA